MCGVFGFVAGEHGMIDRAALRRVAIDTQSRGRHAFGFAWIDSRGRLKRFKSAGAIGDHLDVLDIAWDARLLIGHCRYATQGHWEANENNHPHPADGGWIVHNGVVSNYADLVERHGLHPSSDCDSEVLGQLIEEGEGTLVRRAMTAVGETSGPLVLLGLWSRPARMVVIRRDNPLHCHRHKDGSLYFASLASAFASASSAIRNHSARVVALRDGTIRQDIQTLGASHADRQRQRTFADSW